MTDNLLVLHPDDPAALPDPGALVERLRAIGLIGEPFDHGGETRWRAGEGFLNHVTFLGCSPVIATEEPGANGEFSHVSIAGPYDRPCFLAGANVKEPRCPHCGYGIAEWRDVVGDWQADPAGHCWRCPICGRDYTAPRLRWRHSAGFGRLFLLIRGVFESEAVPGDALTDALAAGGGPGRYFYLRR